MRKLLNSTGLFLTLLLCLSLFVSCTKPSNKKIDPPVLTNPTPVLPIPELKVLQTLSGHDSSISTYTVASNGTIAIEKGAYTHLIDSYTGNLKQTLVHKDTFSIVNKVFFVQQNNYMVVNNIDGATVWDLDKNIPLYSVSENISHASTDGELLFSEEGIYHSDTGNIFFNSTTYRQNHALQNNLTIATLNGPIFSPDYSVFAITSQIDGDLVLEIRETVSDTILQTIKNTPIKNQEYQDLFFSGDNSTFVIVNHQLADGLDIYDAHVNSWQLSDGKLLNSFTRRYNNYTSDYWSEINSNGDILAISTSGKVELVSLQTGKITHSFPIQVIPEPHLSPPDTTGLIFYFSPDGQTLLINSELYARKWSAYDVDSGQLKFILVVPSDVERLVHPNITFSNDSSMFFLHTDNSNSIYNLNNGEKIQEFDIIFWEADGYYDTPEFMSDNKTVLFIEPRNLVSNNQYEDVFTLYKIHDGSEIISFKSGTQDHVPFSLSIDNEFLASYENPINIWALEQEIIQQRISNLSQYSVENIYISPDKKILATISDSDYSDNPLDYHISFWNMENGQLLNEKISVAYPMGFTSDSKYFNAGLKQWGINTGTETLLPILPHDVAYSAFNSDSTILVTAIELNDFNYYEEDENRVELWNINDGKSIKAFSDSVGRVTPNGELLVLSNSSSLDVIATNTGTKIYTLSNEPSFSTTQTYDFSSNSRIFAHVNYSNEVLIWNLQTGLLENTISFKESNIDKVKLSPDGSYIAIAKQFKNSKDQNLEEISLWRVKDGALVQKFDKLINAYNYNYSIAFSSDGTKLIIGLGHIDHINTITVYGSKTSDPIFLNQSVN